MAQAEQPQIYLVTPPEFELSRFPDQLAGVLDSHDIACVRLALATRDEDRIARAADALREVTHARDVALVIDSHILMVERLGLDGVHLPDGARNMRKARKELGEDAIVGAFCGASRHDGMNAGEAGADYISFGPLSGASLGDGRLAERELFEWWSLMIELPVVAEGGLTPDIIRDLTPVTDFFAIGSEIWGAGDPASELAALKAAMG
ncbi:thiamine-phosphate pyrophosphorylase [Lutimaribacter pacificus]|uniref:Thiamine-phosphate pyrophosphorylase n=1 Tax=Lutimaribacter pacificus TaxID=391948 RepID=A0A1H0ESN4_9RHOB|nr:thiamine phosphate synthase [Lutimaribacter pacificus]SDN85289.1 thiamine-phosphate pyrophosphorylase [Lutimaribacter pacificus]SHK40625.1 thiamine-phosphate pyrophosphorylase [Lutimaribacter pacificus]